MLIKKVGYKLFISTKLYKIIYRLAPLLMFCSLLLLYILPNITQQYKFQQPILKTKIFTLQNIPQNSQQLPYQQIYSGVKIALIYGRLSWETVLLVSQCQGNSRTDSQQQRMFWNIYHNIKNQNRKGKKLLAKNVGFVCYNQSFSLYKYMRFQAGDAAYKPQTAINLNLGIIRNALLINLQPLTQKSRSQTRIYFNIYSPQSQLHVDLDYYQAIKQLLQQVSLTKWQPCRYIDQNYPLKKLTRLTNIYQWSFALKHAICQFYQTIFQQKQNNNNKNYIFLQNGIQAATIDIVYKIQNQTEIINKISRLGLSFLQEFVVMEDHLHSSSTIFLPFSQVKYISMKGLILPGIAFIISTAIYLIIKVVYLFNSINTQPKSQPQQNNKQIQQKQFLSNSIIFSTTTNNNKLTITSLIIFTLNFSFLQYLLNQTIILTLIPSFLIRKILIKQNLTQKQSELAHIIIVGICIFICQYFTIFSLPICIVMIVISLVVCFFNRLHIFGLAFVIIGYAIMVFGAMELYQQLRNISVTGQIILYPLLLKVLIL